MRYPIAFAVAVCAAGSALAQTGTLDQNSPFPPGAQSAAFNVDATFLIWQAQIKAGLTGQLEGIKITFTSGAPGSQINLRVRDGAAPSGNPALYDALVTKQVPDLEVVFVDMTASNIMLTAGQFFVMETQGTGTGCWIGGSYVAPPGTPLYPEPLFLNGTNFADGGWRHGFETYVIEGSPCYPDCNNSGGLSIADFICFQAEYVAGNLAYADCNNSGGLSIADFICFQAEYVAGCP